MATVEENIPDIEEGVNRQFTMNESTFGWRSCVGFDPKTNAVKPTAIFATVNTSMRVSGKSFTFKTQNHLGNSTQIRVSNIYDIDGSPLPKGAVTQLGSVIQNAAAARQMPLKYLHIYA